MNNSLKESDTKTSMEMPWGQSWDEWNATRPKWNADGHQLGYNPEIHAEGKGFVLQNGNIWTWPTHMMRPQHMEYKSRLVKNGLKAIPGSSFHIATDRDGRGYVHFIGDGRGHDDGVRQLVAQADPRLKYQKSEGYVAPTAPKDFGHAQNIVDFMYNSPDFDDFKYARGRYANILDRISDELDPRVWLNPKSALPILKPEHRTWIINTVQGVLAAHGYSDCEEWLSLAFTGSLTTYQYSDGSDVDVSLFVNSDVFPEWSRAELIGIMVSEIDGNNLPGTNFPMQCYVVPQGITKEDLYKPGLRSGYDLDNDSWIVPPELDRVRDVEHELNGFYTVALEAADKMTKLIEYEPNKAVMFWNQIHKRRQRDQRLGRGDFTASNIVYKALAKRGLFKDLEDLTGVHIA